MLAKDCELADENKEIIAQIIQRCTSSRLCRRALREPDKTLTDLLVLGRMLNCSEKQVEGIEEKAAAAVSALYFKSSQQQHIANRYTEKNTRCIHCGGRYQTKATVQPMERTAGPVGNKIIMPKFAEPVREHQHIRAKKKSRRAT